MSLTDQSSLFARLSSLVALPHSVFALPFALSSLLLAERLGSTFRHPSLTLWLYVIGAVVSARTAAMGFNRLIDARIDGLNPRTKGRELPRRSLTTSTVVALVLISSACFLIFSAMLGKHCLQLAPFVLLLLLFYSYTKRFTRYCHFVLGLCLALAPGGAWWVLRPMIELTPILLMLTVLLWVSGFDILYSIQDINFDREHSLRSIPVTVGIKYALRISLLLHLFCVGGFVLIGWSAALPTVYFVGVSFLSLPLIGQHFLISEEDLTRINHAFFTFNGLTSVGYLLVTAISVV